MLRSIGKNRLGSGGRYNDDLGGVPVTYSGIRYKDNAGRIIGDHPHIHFRVATTLVLFAPAIGRSLGAVAFRWDSFGERGRRG